MSSETNQTQRDGCVWSHVWNLKSPEVSVSQMVIQLIAVSCVFNKGEIISVHHQNE